MKQAFSYFLDEKMCSFNYGFEQIFKALIDKPSTYDVEGALIELKKIHDAYHVALDDMITPSNLRPSIEHMARHDCFVRDLKVAYRAFEQLERYFERRNNLLLEDAIIYARLLQMNHENFVSLFRTLKDEEA